MFVAELLSLYTKEIILSLHKYIFLTAGISCSLFFVTPTYSDNGVLNDYSKIPPKNPVSSTDIPADIQKVLTDYVKKNAQYGVTGIPLTMQCPKYNNGEAITINYGSLSNAPDSRKMDNNSLFQIASNSKSFTTVVLLQLVGSKVTLQNGEKHIFSLDDALEQWFPEYPNWSEKEGIKPTIRQVLNMTAGLPEYDDLGEKIRTDLMNYPLQTFTTEDILNSIANIPLTFVPGTSYNYVNTSYVLAGKIIEEITKNTLAEEIKNRIIKPLGLKHTFYINSFPKKELPPYELENLIHGYYYDPTVQVAPYFTNLHDTIDYTISDGNAAGSIISNSSDLNIYGRSLFTPIEHGGKLLTGDQIKQLLTLVSLKTGQPIAKVDATNPTGYGFGIIAEYYVQSNSAFYGHNGGALGFESKWGYLPQVQGSFAFAINSKYADNSVYPDLINPIENFIYKNCL